MSNPDSFIDEVSEEIRRDRLFILMRRYGWIAILLVVLLVGGAAFNEWRKARDRAAAETLGNAILVALNIEDAGERQTALAAIRADGDNAALVNLLVAANGAEGNSAEAASRLQAVSDNADLPRVYRDLAALKRATLPGTGISAAERKAALEDLAGPGAPFRVLAEEQIALIEVETGETDAAIARLRLLLADDEASGALRRRASQLIVALGGTPEPS